jgi:ElaB/YqjD/DUF883 family membrane-anchored ribosome-binding protein
MAGDITATPRSGEGFGEPSKTEQAKQQAGQVAGQAKEQVGQVAGQAKEQVGQAAGQARSRVKTQIDQRTTQAGEQVSTQAGEVRSVAQSLREQGKDKPAQYVEQAADRIEGIGDYLKRADADEILHQVEDFGRQRPWAVIAGGLGLGFLASRFLKASSSQRYESRYSSSPQGLPTSIDRPAGVTAPAGTYGTGTGGTYGAETGTYGAGTGAYGGPAGVSAGGTAGTGVDTLSSGVVSEPAATRTGQPIDERTETERTRESASDIPIPPSPGGLR